MKPRDKAVADPKVNASKFTRQHMNSACYAAIHFAQLRYKVTLIFPAGVNGA